MRKQNKKYLSLYLYKGKIGHLYARENKKRPTHPRTTKRFVRIARMYRSLLFLYVFLSRGLVGALS